MEDSVAPSEADEGAGEERSVTDSAVVAKTNSFIDMLLTRVSKNLKSEGDPLKVRLAKAKNSKGKNRQQPKKGKKGKKQQGNKNKPGKRGKGKKKGGK